MQGARRASVLGGAALLVVNAVQHLVVEAVVASTWPGDSYSYARNVVSDLGASVCGQSFSGRDACSPMATTMNVSFLVNGVLLLLAAVALRDLLDRWRGVLLALAVVYALGMAGVGTVQGSPESVADGTYAVHTVGAALALGTGNLVAILAGLESPRIGAPRWYAAASVLLGVVGLLGLVGIPVLSGEHPAAVLERVSVYAINAWWLVTGTSLVVAHRRRVTGVRAR